MEKYRNPDRLDVLVVKYTGEEVLDLSLDMSHDEDVGDVIIRSAREACGLDVPTSTYLVVTNGKFCVYMEVDDA